MTNLGPILILSMHVPNPRYAIKGSIGMGWSKPLSCRAADVSPVSSSFHSSRTRPSRVRYSSSRILIVRRLRCCLLAPPPVAAAAAMLALLELTSAAAASAASSSAHRPNISLGLEVLCKKTEWRRESWGPVGVGSPR